MRLTVSLLVVGVLLLIGSALWSRDLGVNRFYSEEDAREYSESSLALHDALHASAEHEHAGDTAEDADVAGAQARFNRARDVRDAALSRRTTSASVLKWGGIVVLFGGFAAYWYEKQRG